MTKHTLFFFALVLLSSQAFSQILFEKGYYIDNSDQKTECLIKNIDWRDNPEKIEYKISENSESLSVNITTIKEFSIYNVSKYIRVKVNMDTSPDNLNNLTFDKNPILTKETLFLKVLVEGKSNLYLYVSDNLLRFFYNKENATIEQLIYKRYFVSENQVENNNHYKQQLWNDLKCPSIEMSTVQKLEYKKNSLVDFFTLFNKCNNSDFTDFEKKVKKDLFNLNFRAHINNTSATTSTTFFIENSLSDSNYDFGNKLGLGIGVEAEFIFPYNKNKWALIIEPNYKKIKSENTFDINNVSGGKLTETINCNLIELPVGIRYYFFLNKNSKVFINTSYIFDISPKSSIEYKRADNSIYNLFESGSNSILGFGIGYKFKDKYNLEMRYQTSKNILADYYYSRFELKTFSFIMGYSIF